ncbi:MAG: class I SAM-dependent methyltransferase [Spirochaetota bacterium]
MFNNFPKMRPSLPKKIEDIYLEHYIANREGRTAASFVAKKMESWLHRQVASDVENLQNTSLATLEIGAGTLNQLLYEPINNKYDIVEPFSDLYNKSSLLENIRNIYCDISEIPKDNRYNRITSVAVLEHVCNLPEVIARSCLLLSENGVFRSSIPSEGTFLWGLCWKLSSGLEFKLKFGLDYSMLMKHEHINTAKEIDDGLNYFFEKVKCKVFGLSKSISIYRYYECRIPNIKRCEEYLKTLSK